VTAHLPWPHDVQATGIPTAIPTTIILHTARRPVTTVEVLARTVILVATVQRTGVVVLQVLQC